MDKRNFYDVIICGGGLAGLTCARQIRLILPQVSVAVLERVPSPLAPAAHKVGESSVEGGAHYFTEQLGLTGYFNKTQLPKLGLRMFFGNTRGPLQDRPELGARKFAAVPAYQIDRGILENDLRRMAAAQGVKVIENVSILDVDLATNERNHTVHFRGELGVEQEFECRFMIDATGRRRMLHQKLGLGRENGHRMSAAWWRMKGEYDIEKMAGPLSLRWKPPHQERRWFSTNHLMGYGYWVWLIPLSSGNTSIGIVTDETIHPVNTYNTFELSMQWLYKHEPSLARFLEGGEILDFLVLKNASYSAKQIFSHHRWACIGIAALFLDAFYSPGSDFIAYTNSMAVRMIELDLAGKLTQRVVDRFNRFVIDDVNANFVQIYRDNYVCFGSTPVMFTKIFWDTCFYWALPCQMLFQKLLVEPDALDEFHEISQDYYPINERMQAHFRRWAPVAKEPKGYVLAEWGKVPIAAELHLELLKKKSREQCFRDMRRHVDRLGQWAEKIISASAVPVAQTH
jgi:flavin-dependent dehydrogenase